MDLTTPKCKRNDPFLPKQSLPLRVPGGFSSNLLGGALGRLRLRGCVDVGEARRSTGAAGREPRSGRARAQGGARARGGCAHVQVLDGDLSVLVHELDDGVVEAHLLTVLKDPAPASRAGLASVKRAAPGGLVSIETPKLKDFLSSPGRQTPRAISTAARRSQICAVASLCS